MNPVKETISIIIPCYNEEESIYLIYTEMSSLADTMQEVDFEFLFIDDGSKDNTLRKIKNIRKTDSRVRYISFSRNFGKESAMYAGLSESNGDYAVIIDADLQHHPKYINHMYLMIKENKCDCAAARRKNREGEPKIRSYFSNIFYKLINKISSTEIPEGATDFRLMSRKMVDSVLSLEECNRFSKGIFSWIGFDTKWIDIHNEERVAGESTWTFWGLLVYSMEGILAYSTAPLMVSSVLGLASFLLSICYGLYITIKTLVFGADVAGWPTLTCLVLFLSGIQLLSIGILGQYLAKIYIESKRRPIYISKETDRDI